MTTERHIYIGDKPSKNWIKIQTEKLRLKYPEVDYIGHGYIRVRGQTSHGARHVDRWGRVECDKQPSPFSIGYAYCLCGERISGTSHEEIANNLSHHVQDPGAKLPKVKRPPPPPDKNAHEAVHFLGAGPLRKLVQSKEDEKNG